MGIFEKTLISGAEIEKYIPQRAPMIMVTGFHGIKDECFHTSLDICPNNIFCSGRHFTEAGIIEHIAQSCAFRNGYMALQASEKVKLGFIGAVTNMRIFMLPAVGERLQCTVRVEQEFLGISLVKASVTCNGKTVAEGKVKVALIGKES